MRRPMAAYVGLCKLPKGAGSVIAAARLRATARRNARANAVAEGHAGEKNRERECQK
jgi:hypothetical protein